MLMVLNISALHLLHIYTTFEAQIYRNMSQA